MTMPTLLLHRNKVDTRFAKLGGMPSFSFVAADEDEDEADLSFLEDDDEFGEDDVDEETK